MLVKVGWLIISYLLGAIPFGLLYSLYIKGEDVRTSGSGNIGATNIIRNYGWPPGVLTLFLDMLKGGIPVYVACWFVPSITGFHILAGGFAILGHIYPVYLKFSGGKGVATSTGVFAVLTPKPLLLALVVFVAGVGATRYMSVGSLLGAIILPVITGYFSGYTHPYTMGTVGVVLLVLWRHRENISRLYHGEENTFF
ncbi:MAG: glycerol-3-phosphate 1-O-acyltransferase PlsY [bacterium]